MDYQPDRQFPWNELGLLLIVGIPAFAIALLCALFVWTYTGPQFDIVIVNDHEIGGTFDRVVALVLATLFGAVGIFSALRFHRRMSSCPMAPGPE
jgi:hypothetical protein